MRFGSISGGMWAGRFYGTMGQHQLLFSATWYFAFMSLAGELVQWQKAREVYANGRKTEPYGSQCADCQCCQC